MHIQPRNRLRRSQHHRQLQFCVPLVVTAGPTYRLFGIPVSVTNKLDEGTAVLADTSQIAIARDVAPKVTILTELYAKTDETAIRVVTRYDLGLLHPAAGIVLSAGGS